MFISVGGLMSGLDNNNIIDQLKSIQRQPIFNLQQQEADYQMELSASCSL